MIPRNARDRLVLVSRLTGNKTNISLGGVQRGLRSVAVSPFDASCVKFEFIHATIKRTRSSVILIARWRSYTPNVDRIFEKCMTI